MRRLLFIATLVVVLASPALAAGPDDGLYLLTGTAPGYATRLVYVSMHQNDAFLPSGFNILILNLNPSGTSWDYGLLLRTGNTIQGTLYAPNGQAYGSAAGTLSGGVFNGQTFIQGVLFTTTGSRLF